VVSGGPKSGERPACLPIIGGQGNKWGNSSARPAAQKFDARLKKALGIGAAAPFTSRRELEALFLDQAGAGGNHIGVVLLAGVLAHLGQRDVHAERGAVGTV
jgi:hypothetical protein